MALCRSALRRLARPSSSFTGSSSQATVFRRNGSGGSHFNEPSGYIFGERPAPLGKRRVREDWELVYYWGMFGSMGVGLLLYIYNPNDSPEEAARKEALRRMKERGDLPHFEPSAEWKPVN